MDDEPIHLQKPRYLKSRSRDLGHVTFEFFHLPLCIVHALAYPTKKNEVSSVIRAKVTEGSDYLNSRSRDLGHAPFGSFIFH